MVNLLIERPTIRDHVGYNIIHWIISQSGMWYTKFNENIQHNLRTIESGVAVIDEILTPQEDDILYDNNNEFIDRANDRLYYYHNNAFNRRLNQINGNNYRVNGNDNNANQLNDVNNNNNHLGM
ncbi:hypothetical protein PVAND_003951 [Polypedilum vanderplanki]|uniref:Uncharacterized protein n=1 Tax=Polypedilum vanderplanki TaxID=319348 RepID=A0A9J6BWP0_POLVA|nr:hypothetical protein PVAND_003951 [Polypedilum vanderplanki]